MCGGYKQQGHRGEGPGGANRATCLFGEEETYSSSQEPHLLPLPHSPGLYLPKHQNTVENMWTKGVSAGTWGCTGLYWRYKAGDQQKEAVRGLASSKPACRGLQLMLVWPRRWIGQRRCPGGCGPHLCAHGAVSMSWHGGGWRGLGDMRQERQPHILVSGAPLGRSPEGSWEQSVRWLSPTSSFPPPSSLGQKGRCRVQEEEQDWVPIPQGKP